MRFSSTKTKLSNRIHKFVTHSFYDEVRIIKFYALCRTVGLLKEVVESVTYSRSLLTHRPLPKLPSGKPKDLKILKLYLLKRKLQNMRIVDRAEPQKSKFKSKISIPALSFLEIFPNLNYMGIFNYFITLTLPLIRTMPRLFWLALHPKFLHSMQTLLVILLIDAVLLDDEPLWEPIEWSALQTWILFIFTFAWIAENLITSRYGSYVGKDKRVWLGWYKSMWMIELFYALNYGVATIFVIIPFYNEITYSLFFVVSWWNWYSRVFFFKFIGILTLLTILGHYIQMNIKRMSWVKALYIVLFINISLSYMIYSQFIILLFGYFTNTNWYQQSRVVNYVQLSHEPLKWAWGPAKRDNFRYHQSRNVFWFKNDSLFAASFLMFHMFFLVSLFSLYIYWVTLFRRMVALKEIPLTYFTYCLASLKQFLYFFMLFYVMVFVSFLFSYTRLPIEQSQTLDSVSWRSNLLDIYLDYPTLIQHIFSF